MNLLYFNKITTNNHWGAENFLNEALKKNDVNTLCLDYEQHKYQLSNFVKNIRTSYDGVLVQRGVGYNFPISILRNIHRPKILLFTELVKRNFNQHYLLKSGAFDHIFVRSQNCYDFLIEKKWVSAERLSVMLSAALDIFLPENPVHKDIDVLFVGAITERRKKILNQLSEQTNLTIQSIFGEDFYKAIQRSKIILNLHGSDFLDTETRVFETLACKGFLVTEKLAGESPFISGEHLVECDKIDDLSKTIGFYLNHPNMREKITQQGFELVRNQHTYHHRAVVIKAKFNQIISQYSLSKPIVNISGLRLSKYEENRLKLKDYGYGQVIKHYQFSKKLLKKMAPKKPTL